MGRTTEARTITVGTTSASAALTGTAFDKSDVGRTIVGAGIPALATVSAVASATAATLSANATATASVPAVIGALADGSLGFTGWSPETGAEALSYTVAANIAGTPTPDRLTDIRTPVTINNRRQR